jgi:FtsH-binding integral membrane protein
MENRTRAFVRSVYGWMFGGLLTTAFAAMWVVMSPAMQKIVLGTPMVRFGLIIAELGIVFWLSFRIRTMAPSTAAAAFLVYSLLNGLTLSVIAWAYTPASITMAFVTAAAMFGAMSVYGMVTKRDLTSIGSFFFMGLIGIMICVLINMFLKSTGLDFVISLLGVVIFLGLTAWDNQKLKVMATATGPQQESFAVIGALMLYLDFINLFLFLLRLFGGRRR